MFCIAEIYVASLIFASEPSSRGMCVESELGI